jgi:hypothetical protein
VFRPCWRLMNNASEMQKQVLNGGNCACSAPITPAQPGMVWQCLGMSLVTCCWHLRLEPRDAAEHHAMHIIPTPTSTRVETDLPLPQTLGKHPSGPRQAARWLAGPHRAQGEQVAAPGAWGPCSRVQCADRGAKKEQDMICTQCCSPGPVARKERQSHPRTPFMAQEGFSDFTPHVTPGRSISSSSSSNFLFCGSWGGCFLLFALPIWLQFQVD